MKKLLIFGASGHGKVVAEIAGLSGWRDIEFYDDGYAEIDSCLNYPVRGGWEEFVKQSTTVTGVIVAIGENTIRLEMSNELLDSKAPLITLVHPAATISKHVKIGEGSVVMAGAIINGPAKTGVGTILNTGSSIDHDCILGDAVHLSPGARLAGGVKIGDRTWIGMNASVIEKLEVGSDVTIGAGSVVLNNIEPKTKIVGVPGKPLG